MNEEESAKRLAFWEQLLESAFQTGMIHIEAYVCEKCGQKNFLAHVGVESMQCVKCDTRRASCLPRPPQSGDVLAMHYETSLRLLAQVHQGQQAEIPPLMAMEITSLPPGIKSLLARHRSAVVMETLGLLKGAAEELATATFLKDV